MKTDKRMQTYFKRTVEQREENGSVTKKIRNLTCINCDKERL